MKKSLLGSVLLLLLTQQMAGAAPINLGASFSHAGAIVNSLFRLDITHMNPDNPASAFMINSISYSISFDGLSLQAAADISADPQIPPCSNPKNCSDYSDLPANSVTEIFLTYHEPTCPLCGELEINNSATIISLQPAWSNDNYLLDTSGLINSDSTFAIVGDTVSGAIVYNGCITAMECFVYGTWTQFYLSIVDEDPKDEVKTPLQPVPAPSSLALLSLGLAGLGLRRRWRS